MFITLMCVFAIQSVARAANWMDANYHFRRPIDVIWDDKNATGDELATVEFYTDGHALPNADDVRIATEDGHMVASHLLMAGPGDRVRMVFSLQKEVRKYFAYFGNPKPTPPEPILADVQYKSGLLLETRIFTGGNVHSFEEIDKAWSRGKPSLGKMMFDAPFLGYNPFGDQVQYLTKMTGSLQVPVDGEYQFAMAVDDEGALYIDGKPALLAHLGGADIRFNTKLKLTHGRHDFAVCYVNLAGEGFVSVGWKRPDTAKVEVMNRTFFGTCVGSAAGTMEEHGKTLVGDYSFTPVSECYFADDYALRFKFTAGKKEGITPKYEWDFGDGQHASTAEVDHVYIKPGTYTIKLTARVGGNADTQSNVVDINRNWPHILDTRQEPAEFYSDTASGYELATLPVDQLARIVWLQLAANRPDHATPAALKLAAMDRLPDASAAFKALSDLEEKLINADKADVAVTVWDKVPKDSPMQPAAARRAAELSLWYTGDFDRAVKLLQPYESKFDESMSRLYGQALLLSGKVELGKKRLAGLEQNLPMNRRAALSGAAARTVEFFITEKDAESGDAAWEKWQSRFPVDFAEGYSVVLKSKLIEMRKRPKAAAKLAEAFANAVPGSSYAPQLLDRASKLLASTDPSKSAELRQQLKQKYPEDPLSQN